MTNGNTVTGRASPERQREEQTTTNHTTSPPKIITIQQQQNGQIIRNPYRKNSPEPREETPKRKSIQQQIKFKKRPKPQMSNGKQWDKIEQDVTVKNNSF